MGFLVTPSAPEGTDIIYKFLEELDLSTTIESADYSAYDELKIVFEDLVGDIITASIYLSTDSGGVTFRYSFVDGASNGESTGKTGFVINSNADTQRSGYALVTNSPYMTCRFMDMGCNATANKYLIQGYNTAVAFTTIKFLGTITSGKVRIFGRNYK